MTAQILVQLDDEPAPLPLRDLSWEQVAPCGCTCGVASTEHYGPDVEQARRSLTPNAEERRREDAAGFVYRLGRRDAVIDRLKANCEHEPKWGVEATPIPPAHRWAHGRGRRAHLVPVPEDADKLRFVVTAEPLCGARRDCFGRNWNDYPTCRKCEKAAREIAEATR